MTTVSVSYRITESERCSFDCFDVESALHDEEDIKRNIIYELILRDLSKDTDDYDCGPVPEISEFLQLTNAPLCREIGHSFATFADEFNELQTTLRMLRSIADDFQRDRQDLMWWTEEHSSFVIFRRVTSRLLVDGINWGRIVTLAYFAGRIALRACRIDTVVTGIQNKIQYTRNSLNYKKIKKIGCIAIPVIGLCAIVAYFNT